VGETGIDVDGVAAGAPPEGDMQAESNTLTSIKTETRKLRVFIFFLLI
jgi:hypothetical protein